MKKGSLFLCSLLVSYHAVYAMDGEFDPGRGVEHVASAGVSLEGICNALSGVVNSMRDRAMNLLPETQICAVCQEEQGILARTVTLECGHFYCRDCITTHARGMLDERTDPPFCPLCRAAISNEDLRKLGLSPRSDDSRGMQSESRGGILSRFFAPRPEQEELLAVAREVRRYLHAQQRPGLMHAVGESIQQVTPLLIAAYTSRVRSDSVFARQLVQFIESAGISLSDLVAAHHDETPLAMAMQDLCIALANQDRGGFRAFRGESHHAVREGEEERESPQVIVERYFEQNRGLREALKALLRQYEQAFQDLSGPQGRIFGDLDRHARTSIRRMRHHLGRFLGQPEGGGQDGGADQEPEEDIVDCNAIVNRVTQEQFIAALVAQYHHIEALFQLLRHEVVHENLNEEHRTILGEIAQQTENALREGRRNNMLHAAMNRQALWQEFGASD